MASSSSLIFLTILFSVLLLISSSESTEHFVGDSERLWKDPLPSEEALFNWASHHHFTIGDTIVFKYNRRFEAVHEVTEHDYRKCITKGSRHKEFHGGNTRVVLDSLGVRYFVSGRRSHCLRGLKLAIVVMPPSSPLSLSISPPSLTISPPSLTLPLDLPPSPPPSLSILPPSLTTSPPSLTLPLDLPTSLSLPLSQSPSPSPSLSPSPSPNSSGGGANGRGCMVWLGVSMVMMMLLI